MKNILFVVLATTALAGVATVVSAQGLSAYSSTAVEGGGGETAATYNAATAASADPFFKVEEPLVEMTNENAAWSEQALTSESGSTDTSSGEGSGNTAAYQSWTGTTYFSSEGGSNGAYSGNSGSTGGGALSYTGNSGNSGSSGNTGSTGALSGGGYAVNNGGSSESQNTATTSNCAYSTTVGCVENTNSGGSTGSSEYSSGISSAVYGGN